MKIDNVHAEFLSGNAISSGVSTHSVVSRDGNGDVHANKFVSANLKVTHASTARTSDSIFYSSNGDTVYKNTAAGMRASLGLENSAMIPASSTNLTSNIVARDSLGDIYFRYAHSTYVNMSHTTGTNTGDNIFYSSTDNYIRKNNASGFRTSLNVPTRTGGDASGTWDIDITGDADTLDGLESTSFLRSDADDTVNAGVTYTWSATNTAGLVFVNASYPTYSLEIGGWTNSNTNKISRIRNSSGNLHIDSAADGNLYLNHYSGGTVYVDSTLNSDAISASGEIYTSNSFYTDGNRSVIRGGSPTLYFRDTDGNSAMIHNNSNLLYVLRGATDSETWTTVNSQWPWIWNLTNNDSTCGGSLYCVGNVTAYSDIRHKTDIVKLDDCLEKVEKLNGYTYTRKNDGKRYTGLIAQEVLEVLPEAVSTDEKGEYALAYGNLAGLFVEAMKEMKSRIDALEKKLEA